MKLARKLTLAMVVGIVVISAVMTWTRVERERALFVRDMAHDDRMVGRVFAQAVAAVWAASGERRADWVIRTANRASGPVRVRLTKLDPDAPAPERAEVSRRTLARAAAGSATTEVTENRVTTLVPLPIAGAPPHALELSEPLREQQQYVRASVLWNGVGAAAMVLVCSALALGIGWVFVGRPMGAIVAQIRRIAAGDRSARTQLHQNDEIAELATEVNQMCDRLDEAEQRAEAETEQRIAAVEQLRHADRLRTVGQLASGLAHELGTPLNVVIGRARLIQKGARSPAEAADDARIIAEQAERMAGLIRQLLDFARRREPKREERDLREIARECAELLGQLAGKRRVTLDVAAPEVPVRALVDSGQIQQALTNLVINGIDAMSAGGDLTIRVADGTARPPDAPADAAPREIATLEVEDHGDGIAPDILDRLFEPFFTTKGVGEGTGLGLPVSHGIVRDHGGWIAVSSTLGKGSRFTICLPR